MQPAPPRDCNDSKDPRPKWTMNDDAVSDAPWKRRNDAPPWKRRTDPLKETDRRCCDDVARKRGRRCRDGEEDGVDARWTLPRDCAVDARKPARSKRRRESFWKPSEIFPSIVMLGERRKKRRRTSRCSRSAVAKSC